MKKKIVCLVLAAALLATGSVCGALGEEYVRVSQSELERLMRFEKLDTILYYLETYSITELDYDALIEGAAAGMMYSLDDKYAYYVPVDEYDAEVESLSGQYVGVGAQIMIDADTHKPMVTRVFSGTGAEEAGLQKGDIVMAVDGIVPENNDLDGAAKAMRGEAGTQVRLTIQRGNQLLEFDVTRRTNYANSLEYQMLEGDIGYIILYEFIQDSAKEFAQALNALTAQGMKGLILDLRDNGGGEVDNCLAIADMLLPEGVIIRRKSKMEGEVTEDSNAAMLGLPMAVLVNENSASASEILSGAIKYYGVGTLVGKTTFGKGVIQYLLTLSDNSMINFTCEEYFLPDGTSIHETGIEPDVEQSLEGEYSVTYRRIYDLPLTEDSQMQRALEIVREQIAAESGDAIAETGSANVLENVLTRRGE